MGTSASSGGPGGGVPMIPPWVSPIPAQGDAPDGGMQTQGSPNPAAPDGAPQPNAPLLAPPGRFRATRTSLGRFARTGSQDDMRAGIARYVRTGLGGARRASQRMSTTSKTVGSLYGVLDTLSSGQAFAPGHPLETARFVGRSSEEIRDLIIDFIRPVDGTQDAEASRDSMARAFSELLTTDPATDLTALSQDQIDSVTQAYVAHDIWHRMQLDVGKAVMEKAPDYRAAVNRLQEMSDYVREKVGACFRKRADSGTRLTRENAASLTNEVMRDTFGVFEEYL